MSNHLSDDDLKSPRGPHSSSKRIKTGIVVAGVAAATAVVGWRVHVYNNEQMGLYDSDLKSGSQARAMWFEDDTDFCRAKDGKFAHNSDSGDPKPNSDTKGDCTNKDSR